MKKIIIPIIIAAVLGVGGGITAVMMNKPAVADKGITLPEVKLGKYYLNGDIKSDMYLEVTEDYIAARVVGVDPLEKFKELCRNAGYSEKEVDANAEEHMNDYCAENKYVISVPGTPSTPYMILIHYSEEQAAHAAENDYIISGRGYKFDGKNTISSSLLGEFILAED